MKSVFCVTIEWTRHMEWRIMNDLMDEFIILWMQDDEQMKWMVVDESMNRWLSGMGARV